MKKFVLIFLTTLLLFLFHGSEVAAESVPSLIPVNFYSAYRPGAPLAWYPDPDSEYCYILGCRHFFYGPNIIAENEKYKMWTTINDMIFYFESTDGRNWTNGRLAMSAIQNNWENSGDCRTSDDTTVCGGLSNPVVVKGVTPGWNYTMYYTGGPTINTQTNGGLGVAFSSDGINWARFSGNPIRRFPGGGTFAANALKIGTKRYVFFYGGGNFAQNDSPPLKAVEDPGDGVHLGADITTFGGVGMPSKTAYPIAYDTGSNTCWYYYRDTWGIAGPSSFYIYKGSDCFNNLGTRIAIINQGLTGNIGNGIAGAGIKERDGNGQVVSGATNLQFYFGAGDAWAGWQPKSVILASSPITILDLRQLLSAFTNVFAYNQLAGKFGK